MRNIDWVWGYLTLMVGMCAIILSPGMRPSLAAFIERHRLAAGWYCLAMGTVSVVVGLIFIPKAFASVTSPRAEPVPIYAIVVMIAVMLYGMIGGGLSGVAYGYRSLRQHFQARTQTN